MIDSAFCSFAREYAPPGRESRTKEGVERVWIDFAHGKRRRSAVEGAVRVHEDVRHPVADAAEEDVARPGVELDATAHDGENPLPVGDVEDVLEFVEDDAGPVFCRVGGERVENRFKRSRRGRRLGLHGNGRRARARIDGERGSQPREGVKRLFEESGG